MKNKSQNIKVTFCTALPIFLLVAGCNKNGDSSMDSSTVNANTNMAGAPADNSANNVRDRNNATLTPGDQGNSDADRTITQKIRQAIVSSTNDYSMTAKNVKIITDGGKVTLRGPVKNAEEKSGIESIAKTVAGDANVDNQLEVKANQ
jgi:hyperosmotically inducible protein